MHTTTTPFLMFEGCAEEAMRFYVSTFERSEIEHIERYGPKGSGPEGTVYTAAFRLNGQRFLCIDSPIAHGFTFTPSISLFVTCASEAEVDRLFERLSSDGQVLMPLDTYPFSKRYAWVTDRYGVSWQLSAEDVQPA